MMSVSDMSVVASIAPLCRFAEFACNGRAVAKLRSISPEADQTRGQELICGENWALGRLTLRA